jgi:predicted nucleic acid-binding protein
VIVADTNLIAYLMIQGERTDSARAILTRDPVWAAPLLWRSEFRNVLSLYVRRGHLALSDALEFMGEAEDLLRGREYQVPSAPVLALSQQSGCTAYDCEFVYLARELHVPLVTSDKALLEAFPRIAVSMVAFGGIRPAP